MNKKKYLITGGSGFIGAALVHKLSREGHTVKVLDNNSRGNVRRLKSVINDIEFIEGDIRDIELLKKISKGQDAVCHLAYVNGTKFFYEKPDVVLDIGVKGMINVLDSCIYNGVGELILASSSEVYQTPAIVPTPEDIPLIVPDVMNPRFCYGGGKIISELMAINYGRKYFDRVLIFRPHNVYGPDMGWEHVIPDLCVKLHNSKDNVLSIQGSGEEKRAFIFIDDFIEGLMCVLRRGEHLNVYNIGTQDEITIIDLVNLIAESFNKKVKVLPGKLQQGSTLRRCPDTSKIRSLGFNTRYKLKDGIAKTVAWYVSNMDLIKV